MAVSLSGDALARGLAALVRARETGAGEMTIGEVTISELTPLAGGNARRAWAFRASWSGREEDCVLLARVEPGQLDVDARFEFDTLAALSRAGLPVPHPLWLDEDGAVLGVPGVVMRRGHGRSDIVELLRPGSLITGTLASQLSAFAARLHAVPWPARGDGWQPARMLAGWRAQYEARRMEPLPALAHVFDWLEDHLPAPMAPVLVHGDLRLGNFLHDGERIHLVLDWELSHFGDPAEDIAWMYRRLWSPEAFLPLKDALRAYEAAGGTRIEPGRLRWYRIFGEAKLAVISMSALRRFMDGATDNLRHAGRGPMVNEALLAALRWIEEAETA